MEQKHTPLPWVAGNMHEIEEGICRIYGADTADENSPVVAEAYCEEDTAFIVRAVNAHDALVEALEGAADMLPANVACGVLRAALKQAGE